MTGCGGGCVSHCQKRKRSVLLGSNRSATSTSYGHALPNRRRVHESNLKGALGSIDREVSLYDASISMGKRGHIVSVSPSLIARSSNSDRRKSGRCARQYSKEKDWIHSSPSFPRQPSASIGRHISTAVSYA